MAGPSTWGYQTLGFGAGKAVAEEGGGGGSDPCAGAGSGGNVCTVNCQDASLKYILNDDFGVIAGYGMGVDNVGSFTDGDGNTICVKITATSIGGTAVGTFEMPYSSCSECVDIL